MRFSDLLKIFDLKPRFFFAIALIGGLALFLPQQIKDTLGITQLVNTYRTIIGIVTLVSAILWIVQLQPWGIVFELIEKRKFKKEFSAKLAELSDDGRILLAYCVSRKKQTIHLSAMHAVATALRAKGFLTYVGGIIYTSSMPFNIPAYVWKELVGHKHELLSQDDWDNPQLEDVFNNIDQGMKENERTTYR